MVRETHLKIEWFRFSLLWFLHLISGLNLSDSSELNKNAKTEDLSLLPYSSGTTGLPKGVMLTHRNLVSNCQSINAPLPHTPLVLPTTGEHQDILPSFLPFFHIFGLMAVMIPRLAKGAKIIPIPKYDVDTFLRITKEHRATFLHLVPTVVIQLNNHAGCTPEHFESVRYVMSGASNLAESDGESFKKMYAKSSSFFFYKDFLFHSSIYVFFTVPKRRNFSKPME